MSAAKPRATKGCPEAAAARSNNLRDGNSADGFVDDGDNDDDESLNDRIGRAFFGLDDTALNMLHAAEEEEGEGGEGSAGASQSQSDSLNNAATDAELLAEYADVLCGFGNDDNTDDGYGDEEGEDGGMGVPSASAGFGMGRRATNVADAAAGVGTSSTMWEGLGVEDGGMGLREVSDAAAANGYAQFLDEVDLIRDVFADNGEVEVIRAKPTTTRVSKKKNTKKASSAAACSAQPADEDDGEGEEEEEGRIVSVRVQVMPLPILAAFNKRVKASGGRGTFGSTQSGGGGARCVSKGLHVVAAYVDGYPDRPPLISIEPWHNLLPTSGIIALNKKVVEVIHGAIGSPLIMSLLMMIASEAEALIDAFGEGDVREITAAVRGVGIKTRLASEAMHPDRYLGQSIADIVASLPRTISVQCVENVLRTDLALQFEKMQRFLFDKHVKPFLKMKNIRDSPHILARAEARVAYHGTNMEAVGYIVRDGLLVPGGESGIGVRCGSRFGTGIYSSPDPEFAAMYAQRMGTHYKLLLCAALLGRPDEDDDYGPLEPQFDSRIADGGQQFVVFHRAQMLPCYVLHIRIHDAVTMQQVYPELRNTRRAEMKAIDEDAALGFFDEREIRKRRREVLTRMALKNLPFGFGPRGVHFVVEDVAPVDDDEAFLDVHRPDATTQLADEMYQHETVIQNRYGTSHAHPTNTY